jgi:glycosyltransferase involved in cell wall biosynthesis
MIHDAQVHISPGSYSRAFATYYKLIQPMMASRATRVLTVSDFSRDMLVKFGVARPEQVSVVHNGVDHMLRVAADPAVLQRLGLEQHRYVVALANGQRHKNIGLLLRAFDCAGLGSVKLVLVGPATAGEFRAAGFPVPDNVVFGGRVSDEALRAMLDNALCLAFPSLTEGFGLPPMEAMIVGCPALVAPCGALPEVCGAAAIYADPNDPGAWRDAILGLADDDRRRSEASDAGRAHASAFTWRRSAQQLIDVLRL